MDIVKDKIVFSGQRTFIAAQFYVELPICFPCRRDKGKFFKNLSIGEILCQALIYNDIGRNHQKVVGITPVFFPLAVKVAPHHHKSHDKGFARTGCHFDGIAQQVFLGQFLFPFLIKLGEKSFYFSFAGEIFTEFNHSRK